MSNSKFASTLIIPLIFLLFACNEDENKMNWKQLVTDGGLTEEGRKVNPGDTLHAVGEGFQDVDEIMLNFYWETGEPSYPEGSRGGYYAEIVEKSAKSILIKMPYRMPESRVEVILMRSGDLMKLGEVRLADGQTPKEYRLYGISNNLHKKVFFRDVNQIERIPMTSGETSFEWTIDEYPDFHSVVNAWRTYGLCGLAQESGVQKAFFYDFCTGEWKKLSDCSTLALAGNGINVFGILEVSHEKYTCTTLTSDLDKSEFLAKTRVNSMVSVYSLPKDLKPACFGDYPGVFSRSSQQILLSADKGNGRWAPVIFDLYSGFHALEEVEAEALIPFYFFLSPNGDSSSQTLYKMAGYIITSEKEGSRFCLLDETTMQIKEPFTTFLNRVASVTSTPERPNAFTVHFIAYRSGNITEEFLWDTKEWKHIGASTHDEIVWGN